MAIVGENEYQTRISEELNCFESRLEVHDLPNIYHYWSVGTVRPKLEAFGFSSPQGMFKKYLEELCRQEPNHTRHFISIGSGNCDLEIALAQHLLSQGYSRFVIDCLDMNPAMLERGLIAAGEAGVATQIQCVQGDFNQWEPAQGYHGVIACHSLHHVTNLEGLFRQ